MSKIDFESAVGVLRKEIEWAETEGKQRNLVSEDYHTGYVNGLNQSITLLTCLLEIDEQLCFYSFDPDEVSAKVKIFVDDALKLNRYSS